MPVTIMELKKELATQQKIAEHANNGVARIKKLIEKLTKEGTAPKPKATEEVTHGPGARPLLAPGFLCRGPHATPEKRRPQDAAELIDSAQACAKHLAECCAVKDRRDRPAAGGDRPAAGGDQGEG